MTLLHATLDVIIKADCLICLSPIVIYKIAIFHRCWLGLKVVLCGYWNLGLVLVIDPLHFPKYQVVIGLGLQIEQ